MHNPRLLNFKLLALPLLFAFAIGLFTLVAPRRDLPAADPKAPADAKHLFAHDNLVAWCIVPFDSKKRSPEERADMLKKLGFKHYAYDWRATHLPTFDRELDAIKKNGVELTAVWFPGELDKDARTLLDALKKHELKTQLWIAMDSGTVKVTPEEQAQRVAQYAARVKTIAEEAAKQGCTVGLYNHGGWFGEPENQLAIIEKLKMPNVGMVYNLHHGHEHLSRLPEVLKKIKPHLLAFNINGMTKEGDKKGQKILPLGQGDLDLSLLKMIRDSGWHGPIGILGHTNDDVEQRLQDNLDGLDWLVPQLEGKPAGTKPKPRTMSMSAAPTHGWLAEGRVDYRTPPLTAECKIKLNGKTGYNILLASEIKKSATHWELFTAPKDGLLNVYMPGRNPDHVKSEIDIADGKWHTVAMQFEPNRVRLFVDGKKVADEASAKGAGDSDPGRVAFLRLVEGTIACDGEMAWARLSKGIVPPSEGEPAVDDSTVGLWKFTANQPATDLSPMKNNAKVAQKSQQSPVIPAPGPHLKPADPTLKAVLIDRSTDDAYMAVKADGAGQLFVGGREALFVFEPDGKGGFKPRQQLYKFPQDSIIIGIEYRGDDLYVLTSNALYLMPGARIKRDNLVLKRILWGVPQDFHISFHCLAWGPQGDLYLDHGDPLLGYGDWARPDHWGCWTLYTQPDDTKVTYTGVGAFLRVKPDGSRLKVIAGGVRGPVGLAFDRNYELFSNDNDHESMADLYAPARMLHVTPHADFAWPRGWMASKSPNRSDLLEPLNSAMGRGVPCDLAYYDEPLIPSLRGSLLLCRWDHFSVDAYPLRPRGASHVADEVRFLTGDNNNRPTGITVDRTGRVFVTSHYLGGNVVTPHCVSDLTMITRDVVPMAELGDETTATADQLWTAISSKSGEARRRAHTEILRRGGDLLKDAGRRLASANDDDPALIHLIWLAGTSGSANNAEALRRLARSHARAEIRLQALRVLTDYPALKAPREIFVAALDDPSDAVKLAALAWFFDSREPQPIEAIARLATSSDPYLRQTASRLLARRVEVADLERLIKAADAPTRLAGVLASGIRLTVPPIDDPAPKGVPLHYPNGSSFFSRNLIFADRMAPIDLADLGPVGSYTTAQRWKAVPPSAEMQKLFDLLVKALDDPSSPVKSQSAYYLGLLRDPRSEPLVERVTQELRGAGLAELAPIPVTSAWLAGPFADVKADVDHPPQRGPIDLAAQYPVGSTSIGWRKADDSSGKLGWPSAVGSSTYVYFRVQSRSRQPALLKAVAPGSVRIWQNGRAVGQRGGPTLLDLQPGSNDILIRVAGEGPLTLAVRAKERVSVEAPEKADGALLAERLKGAAKVGPEFLTVNWDKDARTGDAERGRKLFGTLGCAKCHAVVSDQSGGGAPSLADVGRRFTPAYVVESILTPDKQVAVEFRTTILTLANGQTLSGLVVRETPAELELLLPDTSRRIVKVADIDDRKVSPTSPMPAGLVRSPAELKDLLTYLLSDKPTPP